MIFAPGCPTRFEGWIHMSVLRRKWTRRTAQVTAAGLLAASGSMFFASTALAAGGAGGNNGTVKLGSAGVPFTNANDPHLQCPIQIQWSGFDPGTQTYDVAITTTAPTGGTVAVSGDPVHGTFTVQPTTHQYSLNFGGGATPNNKGEYHVNITVNTTSSTGSSDVKHKTVWVGNCGAGPVAPSALTVAGVCDPALANTIDWTVTNPNATDATLVTAQSTPPGVTATPSNLGTITGNNGTASFTTVAPLPAGTTMGATGTVNGQPVSSTGGAWAGGNCPIAGAPEVPASVSFADDCSGTTVNFTSADQHTSSFTVTEPFGASDSVSGTTSKHYSANAGHRHTAITDDKGGTYSHDWADPGNCNPGHAAPAVTEANHCKSGMNVTLSNMNGTAPATFTVVDPDGTVQTITVNAGQLKKLVFAVKEDTTGTVSVTAVGGSKQQFIYKKNCATVLGVKHTRKPPHRPVTKPVVKGEHQQLPFTGFETQRALLGGSALFFLGAVLCIMGARRKEEEPLFY